ncbi:hypothetical protein [Thalassotalea crassostreae]|uniref:hypothetical protein n=1 Tax=Thalassotalea crassostreae TaxID=1763536 RepID=UPI00083994E0|nr:hypothetical protein [Thalassotalea crassostreae]
MINHNHINEDAVKHIQSTTWTLSTLDAHKGDMTMFVEVDGNKDAFLFKVSKLSMMLGFKLKLGIELSDYQKLQFLWICDALVLNNELRYQIWMHVLFDKQPCTLTIDERPVLNTKAYNKSFVRIKDENHLFYISDCCYINGVVKAVEIQSTIGDVVGVRWFYMKDIEGQIIDVDMH